MDLSAVRCIVQVGRSDPPTFTTQKSLSVNDVPFRIKGAQEKRTRTFTGTMRNGRPELPRIERGDRRDALEQLRGDTRVQPDEKKAEERRMIINQQQENIDERLKQYNAKRERFLAFKRELEHLKDVNKQMNVHRQRKREDFHREQVANEVVNKDQRVQLIRNQKLKIWEQRRNKSAHERLIRETVKSQVMEMRIKSRVDSNKIKNLIDQLLNKKTTAPSVISPDDFHIPLPPPRQEEPSSQFQFSRAIPTEEDDEHNN